MENTEGGKACIKKQVKFNPLYQVLGYIGNLQKMIQPVYLPSSTGFPGQRLMKALNWKLGKTPSYNWAT